MLHRTIMLSVFYGVLAFSAGGTMAQDSERTIQQSVSRDLSIPSTGETEYRVKHFNGRSTELWEQIN